MEKPDPADAAMLNLDSKTAALVLCFILNVGGRGQVCADTYPSKPIKLVVAHAAGSSIDLRARQIAERMARGLGQGVIVENRSGAGGTTGVQELVKRTGAKLD
jgi:tripartite-type tricarboxylate transporter receptor subunit TctC